LCFILEYK